MERRFDAAQESIVDQQQTIEKFRELVRHLQAEIADLRQRGESLRVESPEEGSAQPSQTVMSLSQLKTSAIKAHSWVRGAEGRWRDTRLGDLGYQSSLWEEGRKGWTGGSSGREGGAIACMCTVEPLIKVTST